MTEPVTKLRTSSVRSRVVLGLGASLLGPVATALIQVLGVPVFLRFWGAARYGEWLILSAIPIYLSLSDMGFGSVAGNDMTMRIAAGDRDGATEAFQSSWVFVTAISIVLAIFICGGVFLSPLDKWLHASMLSLREIRLIATVLTIYALVALQASLIVSGFRCDGNYPIGILGANVTRIAEWTAATVAVAMGCGPIAVALTYLCFRLAGTAVMNFVLRRKSPWLHYGVRHATRQCILRLAKPAFAFMAFPAGNALSFQGMVLAVGLVLGPVSVAMFSTIRTMTRLAAQPTEAIRNAIWPELSVAFGTENSDLARRLHRKACQGTAWFCAVIVLFLYFAGPRIYAIWTHGRLAMDATLFHWLLGTVVFNSFWYTSSVVSLACNRHQRIATAYLGSTIFSVAVAYVLMPHMGLSAAAIALLATDLMLTGYVLHVSLGITKDSVYHFLASVVSAPFNLNRLRTASAN